MSDITFSTRLAVLRAPLLDLKMSRSLIWVQGDGQIGWACSACRWRFPIPTLLAGKDARDAYDRLAAGKFRDTGASRKLHPPRSNQPLARPSLTALAR